MKTHKSLFYSLLLVAGVVLALVGGLVLKGDGLKSVSGVCIGVGAGVFGLSISQLAMLRIAKKNPAYERKIRIDEKDERNKAIRERAKAKAFDAMGVILGITMLIYALINAELTVILLIVAAYILIYAVQIYYLSKYAKQMWLAATAGSYNDYPVEGKMKTLRMVGIILLVITIAGFLLWRFGVPYPDWAVRVDGILMLAAVFAAVFSTVKITMRKK